MLPPVMCQTQDSGCLYAMTTYKIGVRRGTPGPRRTRVYVTLDRRLHVVRNRSRGIVKNQMTPFYWLK